MNKEVDRKDFLEDSQYLGVFWQLIYWYWQSFSSILILERRKT
jgi:hypothetical protein